MFEYFIARRYLRSKHRLNFISIISILSTVGVTIGVAALVIVLSVFNGFGSLVTTMLINFDPHLRITSLDIKNNNFSDIENELKSSDLVKSYSSYAEGKVILMKNKSMEILNLKGIPTESKENVDRIESRITFGDFDLSNDDNIEKIIVSLPIALRLSVRVGDTLYATSAGQIKNTITRMSMPKTKRMEISGLYEISNKEYALKYTFASLETAQSLFNMRKGITGVEVILDDIDDSQKLKEELLTKFGSDKINVLTWYDLHSDLYNVMLIERWGAFILLSLIVAVAAFNILSSLTMSVLEKKKDIGVLRSMGTTSASIRKIFMFEGILVGVIGTILGLSIGLLICFLQINYNIYTLDASLYVIDTLPVEIRLLDIFAVTFVSLLLTFFASKYPANRALKTKLIEAIKWE